MSEALLTHNANEEQTKTALSIFERQFSSYENHISSLVKAKGLDPKQFIITVINSFKRNPALLECEIGSVFGAVFASAELGLEPNTPFQLSHIIPYNNNKAAKGKPPVWVKEAQFQIGYQGWIELFNRHPKISHYDFAVVYENEEFKQVKGTKPDLIHVPIEDPKERGERKGAYAVAWLIESTIPTWAYVGKSDIAQIKSKSKGSDSEYSPWHEKNDPIGWMWMKVAIKQLGKKLPKTRELEVAIYAEDAADTGKTIKLDDGNKTIKLDPLESQEEKNRNAHEEKSSQVAKGVADMLKPQAQESPGVKESKPENSPEDDIKERTSTAISFFNKLGVTNDRLLHKLQLSNIEEIGVDHLTILSDFKEEIKKGKAPNLIFPPIK